MLTPKALAGFLVASLVVVGCGDQEAALQESGPDPKASVSNPVPSEPGRVAFTYPPVGIPRQEAGGLTEWASHQAESLSQMSQLYDHIIVGRPLSVETGFPYGRLVIDPSPETGGSTPPADNPKSEEYRGSAPAEILSPDPSPRIGPSVSTYQVEAVQVIRSSNVRVGDVIPVRQWGGVVGGVLIEATEDPTIRIGPSYLLFLGPTGDGTLSGPPFARFELDAGGRLQNVNGDIWGRLPAVAALSGQTVEAATLAIQAGLASAQTSEGTVPAAAP